MFKKSESGYTLVEIAVVMMVVGIIVAPAIGLYNLYQKQVRIDQTQDAVEEAWNALMGFRAMYGRYPCPAPMDAVPGDVEYGYEFLDAAGDCDSAAGRVELATSARTTLPNTDIFIGNLPFRQMNLPEELVQDGYLGRLTYAVTGVQTDPDTYEPNNGGIDIVDYAGLSAIEPANSAHVVILSHGRNNAGGINPEGNVIGLCTDSSIVEQENCDYDQTFRYSQNREDFDDLIFFGTSNEVRQWQVSATNNQNIHLRRALNIVTDNSDTNTTINYASAEIREIAVGDGTVYAESMAFSSGAFMTSSLCTEAGGAGVNCFPTERVGGDIADGEGMRCIRDHPDAFLYAIANGGPLCTNDITFNCPPGEFLSGFDASGNIVCNTTPPASCPNASLATTCGGNEPVTGFWQSGTMYGYAYSGQCHYIAGLNTTTLNNAADINAVNTYINTLNNSPRSHTIDNCSGSANNAQVRDTYECLSGVWSASPIRTIERRRHSRHSLNQGPRSGNTAETNGPPYDAANPMSIDPNHTARNHDCWCRETYRVDTRSCSGLSTGTRYRIQKYECPQTDPNRWTTVFPSGGGWNTNFCGCTPGSGNDTQRCSSYFGVPSNSMTGNVTRPYTISCPSGSSGAPVRTYTGADDTSACQCPSRPTSYSTTACPTGETNSFTYDGNSYTGVAQVRRREWLCPGGTPPQPASSAADAGYYSITDTHNEACSCDTTLTQTHTQSCPAGTVGPGITYNLPWNCATGSFDPPSPSNRVSPPGVCKPCSWQEGTLRPGLQSIAAPQRVGTSCSSCGDVSACYRVVSPGSYQVWDGCVCAAN